MTTPTFNLVDRPWIPVLTGSRASPELVSLRDLFTRAHAVEQIADSSPLNTIALYRLLLAILHRAYDGPKSIEAWEAVWNVGRFDQTTISAYMDTWYQRFDLFSATAPFYQTAGLADRIERSEHSSRLSAERASGYNKALLFDHTLPTTTLSVEESARALLAVHHFSAGGTHSYDDIAHKYVKDSPLVGCAVGLIRGKTLFETLLFNWQRYDHDHERPFANRHQTDLPAWERLAQTTPSLRQPTGYTDLLTWQSRRVQLLPARDVNGVLSVDRVIIMKGEHIAPEFEVWNHKEPMVAYHVNKKAANKDDPWIPLGLRTERLVWRDSTALFWSVAESTHRMPVIDWFGELISQGVLPESRHIPLDVFGAITDHAKYLDWRHETLSIGSALLQHPEACDRVQGAIDFATYVARFLSHGSVEIGGKARPSPMHVLCEEFLRNAPDIQVQTKAIKTLAASFNALLRYWSRLDPLFRTFLHQLPEQRAYDEQGHLLFGIAALQQWEKEVIVTCRTGFTEATRNLGTTGQALRAIVQAEKALNSALVAIKPSWEGVVIK